MPASSLRAYADRIEADLRGNLLPFWIEHVVNREKGSFHGELSNDLRVSPDVERGALLSTRILWTYAEAFTVYPEEEYKKMADYAFADLVRLYADRVHGGFIWSVDAAGQPLKTRKQVYGQAFAIYALATYHRATGHPEALELAKATFRLLELEARDPRHGGYREAFARDWSPIEDMRLSPIDLNAPKSQNTHLHLMEAFTALLRVWPDAEVKAAQAELLEVMLTRILDDSGRHLGLFFTDDWQRWNDTVSYGHDIEAAWLLHEAATVLGEPAIHERIRQVTVNIAAETLRLAIDDDGALLYEGNPRDGVTKDHKEWWPQAEALVGFLDAYEISSEERFLRTARGLWDFIGAKLVDREHGEWFRGTDRTGNPLPGESKVSFWKCPYHNGRMGLEAVRRLRQLADVQA
ncbi:MAG: AGE family epimerase/isomerase [Verrucomicrobiota bacterium]